MNALDVSRYVFWTIFISAALIASLTQLQIMTGSFVSQDREISKLISRHRWTGWIALCGLLLIFTSRLLPGEGLPLIVGQINLIHIPLMTICGIGYLRKVWVSQNSPDQNKLSRNLLWWMMCGLGVCFFAVSVLLAIWSTPGMKPTLEATIWRWLMIGHIGLALTLIWSGRSALRRLRTSAASL